MFTMTTKTSQDLPLSSALGCTKFSYAQPCFRIFLAPICCNKRVKTNIVRGPSGNAVGRRAAELTFTTTKTTMSARTTIESRTRLKLSGSKSKPLDGDVRVKKMSGPPNARTSDCDSKSVGAERIVLADSTTLLYDNAAYETDGINSEYWCKPSRFSISFTSPSGRLGSV